MYPCDYGQGFKPGFCEQGGETSDCVNGGELLEQLKDFAHGLTQSVRISVLLSADMRDNNLTR